MKASRLVFAALVTFAGSACIEHPTAQVVVNLEADLANCGVTHTSDLFPTSDPARRAAIVHSNRLHPKWDGPITIWTHPSLAQGYHFPELQRLVRQAGLELIPTKEKSSANLIVDSFVDVRRGAPIPAGIFFRVDPFPRSLRSKFTSEADFSQLRSRSLDLLMSAPEGHGADAAYYPYDVITLAGGQYRYGGAAIGNIDGAIAIDRNFSIVSAECFINASLPSAVQRSLFEECATRVLGFTEDAKAPLEDTFLSLWVADKRLHVGYLPAAREVRECISKLYGGG